MIDYNGIDYKIINYNGIDYIIILARVTRKMSSKKKVLVLKSENHVEF